MKEKVFVSFDHFLEIIFVDRLLSRRVLFLQAFLEHLRRRLQVDDEVRRRQLLAEMVVVAIIGFKFLVVQVEARENLVLFEETG